MRFIMDIRRQIPCIDSVRDTCNVSKKDTAGLCFINKPGSKFIEIYIENIRLRRGKSCLRNIFSTLYDSICTADNLLIGTLV